jgi:membrane protease YdiL (CAAX protease family)
VSQTYAIQAETPPSTPPLRRGRSLLAWLVILAAVGFILWRSWTENPLDKQKYDLLTARLQGRYFIGWEQIQKRFSGGQSNEDLLYEQVREALDKHTYAQRLCFVVLAGELKGPAEARTQLRLLNERYREQGGEPAEEDARCAALLDHLYAQGEQHPQEPPALSVEQQQELRQRLGWFGELALTPDGSDPAAREAVLAPAYRTVYALVAGVLAILGLGLLGLVLLVTFAVLGFLHRLRGGLTTGATSGGIYAETFAVYLLLFLGLSVAGRYAIHWSGLRHGTLALSGLAALGSLAALVWPVLRGIPWRQVRQDIGWIKGRRSWLEPLFGLGGYVAALPMLFVALIYVLMMTTLRDALGWGPEEFGPSESPGHPIVFFVSKAGWWVWLEVLFVACFVAPLVEETMFRGVLYRHLREASARLRPVLSVVVSALIASFLFAAIHPQGLLGIPPLMALALAFALIREWRVTLIPAMAAHSINNAGATLMLLLMMS